MSDIVERLRDEVVGVGDEAADEIVRLREEVEEAIAFRNDMQAAGHAISQGAQVAHDIWRKEQALRKAAEAERDRLRDALTGLLNSDMVRRESGEVGTTQEDGR